MILFLKGKGDMSRWKSSVLSQTYALPPKGELVNQRTSPESGFSAELKFYIPTYQMRKEVSKFILMAVTLYC